MRKNGYGKKCVVFALLAAAIAGTLSGCIIVNDEIMSRARQEQEDLMQEEEGSLWEEDLQPEEDFLWEDDGQPGETSFDQEEVLEDYFFPFTETGGGEVSAIVERVMPAVVSISCISQQEYTSLLGRSQMYEALSDGSGIIIGQNETELLIVTNNHVVEGAAVLLVTFTDDESAEAHVKGTNKAMDLAMIAVKTEEIPAQTKDKIAIGTLGDSDALKAGEGIIAIGNAMGYGQSVTVGYVSALNRKIQVDEQTTRTLIQIDAAINPGNSGGALLNMQGEIVGINSAKISLAEVEGMGYAIPITKAREVIAELSLQKTRVLAEEGTQGYLGIKGKDVSESVALLRGIIPGIRIRRIVKNGAAMSSELREDDIIIAFDGQAVRSVKELAELMLYYHAGECVEVTVLSLENGEYNQYQVPVILGDVQGGRLRDGGL